ncbi:MAG TPA: hypothetical protein VN882_13955 [Steroidobacteraceae bacterium]|jgi:hypothetical protein|nr:hypothetical protein [Steroidobacteraceae bacterium]
MVKFLTAALILCGCLTVAMAQEFPLWEQLLSHYGGKTDETSVPSMKMGNHMQMSLKGKPQPGDERRAREILVAAREVLARYADVSLALRDGYKPFHPTGRMGEEVHYTNYHVARREQQQVDYRQPGSILYRRTPAGMKAVGVMYTAPRDSTPERLNEIAPLSVATWHRHVDFCGGPRTLPLSAQFGPDTPFGPRGSIQTEDACKAAHGLWIPVVFGWMTHVYPDDEKAWGGMDMRMESSTDALKMTM